MSGDSSEEKELPASERKLSNLRRKGQIARSQDIVSVVSLICVLSYIVFFFSMHWDKLKSLFIVTNFGALGADGTFPSLVVGVMYAVGRIAAEIIVPVFGIVIVAVLFATGMDGKGFPISAESIAPKFNKLNPAEGVKKIFNVRNLIQFIKGLFELTLVATGNYLFARYLLNNVLWAPSCGEGCLAGIAIIAILGTIIIGLIILILGAIIDLPMSRWLFKREQKMSHSEVKREMKEDYGSPEIRSARKQRQQQAAAGAGFIGIGKANMLFVGGDFAVGVVYDAEKTPAPMIVAKGVGSVALEYRASVAEKGVAIVEDMDIVTALIAKGAVGEFVPEDMFVPVARALIDAGIIQL